MKCLMVAMLLMIHSPAFAGRDEEAKLLEVLQDKIGTLELQNGTQQMEIADLKQSQSALENRVMDLTTEVQRLKSEINRNRR